MSKEEYKRYIDHSIPYKYNCNGHLIHDCLKNPNRDKFEIMRYVQPKTWMLCEYWDCNINIPINNCPWCERKLDMNFAPEGKKYEVIEEVNCLKEALQIDVREKMKDVDKSVNGMVPIVMKTEFEEYYVVLNEAQGKALIEGIHYAFHPEELKKDMGIENEPN